MTEPVQQRSSGMTVVRFANFVQADLCARTMRALPRGPGHFQVAVRRGRPGSPWIRHRYIVRFAYGLLPTESTSTWWGVRRQLGWCMQMQMAAEGRRGRMAVAS